MLWPNCGGRHFRNVNFWWSDHRTLQRWKKFIEAQSPGATGDVRSPYSRLLSARNHDGNCFVRICFVLGSNVSFSFNFGVRIFQKMFVTIYSVCESSYALVRQMTTNKFWTVTWLTSNHWWSIVYENSKNNSTLTKPRSKSCCTNGTVFEWCWYWKFNTLASRGPTENSKLGVYIQTPKCKLLLQRTI